MDLITELLDKNLHNRNLFDCEVGELNAFLKSHANQNQVKNISKTYVAISSFDVENSKPIYGYYTLSSGQINCDQLLSNIKSKLPKHPVPIARIGRLAVDKNYKGQGVGGFLLHDALTRILNISKKMGIFAVIVDAKDNNAKTFYEYYGFAELQNSGLTLFLPVSTIESAM